MTAQIFTIGHSTRSAAEFVALLRESGVCAIADVRRFPASRRHPQFNGAALAATLAEAGIAYRHFPALGGRRAAAAGGPSPNALWREPGFRNYADYAATAEFRAGFAALVAFAHERRAAVMCAETLWWQCHRRIVADYLIAAGAAVTHILGPGKCEAAALTPGAVAMAGGVLRYPPAQPSLL